MSKSNTIIACIAGLSGAVCGVSAQSGGGPPVPVGYHKCTACHSDDPTICNEKWCAPNTVCGKEEGETEGGMLWVRAVCLIVS